MSDPLTIPPIPAWATVHRPAPPPTTRVDIVHNDAFSPAERRDLHAAALMLEAGHPGVVSKSHFWKFWR